MVAQGAVVVAQGAVVVAQGAVVVAQGAVVVAQGAVVVALRRGGPSRSGQRWLAYMPPLTGRAHPMSCRRNAGPRALKSPMVVILTA